MVKRYLDAKGKRYTVVNLDDEPHRRQEAFDISGGAMTVPITVINKNVVVGWQPAKLAAAIA